MPQAPNQAATEMHLATLEPPKWQVSRSILILSLAAAIVWAVFLLIGWDP
jgi:hypothetical protein